ncbi:MAG: ribosomal protein L13e [Candidatus Thorarchaeota archaeon]|jgi:large subunit ribosomal protein L13e
MSYDIAAEPRVKSPGKAQPRRGRGFSIDETKQAGLTIIEARSMGLIIDVRRKTTHEENVEILKQYIKDLDNLVAELTKTEVAKPKRPKKDDKAAAELSSLRAVKKAEAEQLVTAGIKSLSDLAYCDIDKVAKKTGIDEDRITAMVKAALKKI